MDASSPIKKGFTPQRGKRATEGYRLIAIIAILDFVRSLMMWPSSLAIAE
jgi:hypothetical protein